MQDVIDDGVAVVAALALLAAEAMNTQPVSQCWQV